MPQISRRQLIQSSAVIGLSVATISEITTPGHALMASEWRKVTGI